MSTMTPKTVMFSMDVGEKEEKHDAAVEGADSEFLVLLTLLKIGSTSLYLMVKRLTPAAGHIVAGWEGLWWGILRVLGGKWRCSGE